VTKQFEGDVDQWNEKGFGFIRHPGGRIFFSAHGVEPDWKGSRSWAFARGIPVKFNITQRVVGGASKHCATSVEPLFPMSEPESLHSYRETSEIVSLNRQKGFAFLFRPCGDALFIHKNDVVPGFETRWDILEIGSPVYHGVQVDEFSVRWKAANAELYSYDELQGFKNEEQEPEPEVSVLTPEPIAVEPQSRLLRPENCRRTLLELIQQRRAK
jgi:cold shock CspA family protein